MIRFVRSFFLPFMLTLLLVPLILSCYDSHVRQQLNDADSVIDTAPDLALSILDGIDKNRIIGDRDKGRYSLLLTYATLKTQGFAHADKRKIDSIFKDAYSCFGESSQPSRENMLTHYVSALLQDSPEKILKEFDTTIKLSAGENSDYYKMMAYFNKAVVYHNAYSSEDEVACVIDGEKYISDHIDPPAAIFVYQTLGQAYFGVAEDSIAEIYFRKMYEYADKSGNTEKRHEAKLYLATIAGLTGDCNLCAGTLDSMLLAGEIEGMTDVSVMAYALSLVSQKRFVEAEQVIGTLQESDDTEVKNYYYTAMAKLYAAKGLYYQAYAYQDSLLKHNNDLVEKKLSFDISRKERDLKEELLRVQTQLSKQKERMYYLSVGLMFLSSVFMVALLVSILKKQIRKQRHIKDEHKKKEEENIKLSTELRRVQDIERNMKITLEMLYKELEQLQQEKKQQEEMRIDKETQIRFKDEQIRLKDERIKNIEGEIKKIDEQNRTKDEQIRTRDNQIKTRDEIIANIEIQIKDSEKIISLLRKEQWEIQLSSIKSEVRILNNRVESPSSKKYAEVALLVKKFRDEEFTEKLKIMLDGYSDGLITYLSTHGIKKDKLMIIMWDMCGMSYKSIAEVLGVSLNNASVIRSRVKNMILSCINEDNREDAMRFIPMLEH